MNRKLLDIPRPVELGCVVITLAVLGAVFYPVWRSARPAQPSTACLSNVKQCAMAEIMYATDHDDRLPPATIWVDAVSEYSRTEGVFTCPSLNSGQYGYAMNCTLPPQPTEDFPEPAHTVLLFESVLLARNACSGVYGFPNPPRHNDRNVVAYVDGHVRKLHPGMKP